MASTDALAESGGLGTTPKIAPPQPGTTTTVEPALPDKQRRECHTIDLNDESRGVCGYKFRSLGSGGGPSSRHSKKSCRQAGHKHCAACDAMSELGLDGRRG